MTKTHPPEAAAYAARYGLAAVGENRVQEGVEKRGQTSAAVRWELIGHLQSNKSALAVRTFDRIQSVDSEKLLTLLDRAAGENGKTLPILPADQCRQRPGQVRRRAGRRAPAARGGPGQEPSAGGRPHDHRALLDRPGGGRANLRQPAGLRDRLAPEFASRCANFPWG